MQALGLGNDKDYDFDRDDADRGIDVKIVITRLEK